MNEIPQSPSLPTLATPASISSMLTFVRKIAPAISLETLKETDTEELFSVVDANRAYLRRWLPWLDGNQSLSDTLTFIQTALRNASNFAGLAAAIRVDNQIAGVAGFHAMDWNNRNTALGYWLAEPYQGRGIMTRASQALIDFAFAALNLNRVTIACAVENTRSRAIPERLGLTHEGIIRDAEWLYTHYVDHAIYSLLQREWQAKLLGSGVTLPSPPSSAGSAHYSGAPGR